MNRSTGVAFGAVGGLMVGTVVGMIWYGNLSPDAGGMSCLVGFFQTGPIGFFIGSVSGFFVPRLGG